MYVDSTFIVTNGNDFSSCNLSDVLKEAKKTINKSEPFVICLFSPIVLWTLLRDVT